MSQTEANPPPIQTFSQFPISHRHEYVQACEFGCCEMCVGCGEGWGSYPHLKKTKEAKP